MPGEDDAASAVLTVAPNGAGGLIGAGPTGAPLQPVFGNTDFKAYNIDFQNRAVRLILCFRLFNHDQTNPESHLI
jgi:hypothetical protein